MGIRNLLVKLGLLVGKAAAKFDPSGVADHLLDAYGKGREREQLRAELEALMRANLEGFRGELADAMGELRLHLADGVREQVEGYLSQVPAAARQAARVLGDPSATTVPATVAFDSAGELAAFLPQRLPRFRAGDSVPGLPSWRLVEPLGAGGFGEVWKAENPYFGEPAAFKFFLDPTARKRFTEAEAKALAEIHRKAPTDGVVKLLQAEPGQDPPWLQFEYVAGGDLTRVLESWAKLPAADRVTQARAVIRTLAGTAGHFHQLGVVHRDLKPSNVLLRPVGARHQLVIADFGISKLVGPASAVTPAGSSLATIRAYTPAYASPQQKKFRPADPRDDVYALGVLWYQLLRGDLTAERPSGDGWKRALAKLGVSAADVALLNRCWDDEPDERPADGGDLAAEMGGVGDGPVPVSPPPPPDRGFEPITVTAPGGAVVRVALPPPPPAPAPEHAAPLRAVDPPPREGRPKPSRRSVVVGGVVGLGAVGGLGAAGVYVARRMRAAGRVATSSKRLTQIGQALHNYHDANGRLSVHGVNPACYTPGDPDSASQPFSWRVAILPYLQLGSLFDRFDFKRPWDAPENRALVDQMPEVYQRPEGAGGPGVTHFQMVMVAGGPSTMRPGMRLTDITDGTSNTIAVVEAAEPVEWTKPADVMLTAAPGGGPPPGLKQRFGGIHPGGFHALMWDGSVVFVKDSVDEWALWAAIQPTDGFTLPPRWMDGQALSKE